VAGGAGLNARTADANRGSLTKKEEKRNHLTEPTLAHQGPTLLDAQYAITLLLFDNLSAKSDD
jgi:hypothetical protein